MAESKTPKPRNLGRGLSALIGDAAPEADGLRNIGIDLLVPGAFQPRRVFAEADLEELAKSLKKQGVLQPIVVRRLQNDKQNRFEIVAGERRWRAAQRANLHEVPVLIRALTDREALEIAIVENVQRADLNPIEEADAFRRLMDEFDYTQEQLATTLGKSRSHVANMLRLEGLSPFIREALVGGKLSVGHARPLIGLADADALAREVLRDGLNVRQVEQRVAAAKDSAPSGKTSKPKSGMADTRALERRLSQASGLQVKLRDKGGKGVVEIGYKTLDQLDDLIARLTR